MESEIFFDYSKLKPEGCHYVAVGLSLPYTVHLPIDSYDVEIESQISSFKNQIIIENRWKNQQEARKKFPFAGEGILIEQDRDTQANYRYTWIWVFIPIATENLTDLDKAWKQILPMKDRFCDLAISIVNRFLEVYRFNSKQYHIKFLTGREVQFDYILAFMLNENPPHSPTSNFTTKLVQITYWGDRYPQINPFPDKIVSNIRAQLKSLHKVPLSENLLLNAYNYFDQGEHRLAVIEAETAFEAAIYQHLRKYFRDNLDDLAKAEKKVNYNFTRLVKGEFCRPAFGDKQFDDEIIEFKLWRSKVMELRNNLVHAKIDTVTKEEAHDAIQTIEDTLNYLIARPKTELHQLL